MAESSVRTQLMVAALDAATVHGITKLSMGDVARTAGLSRQTLYRYFPNKDALVAEVVAEETARLIEQVLAAGAQHEDPRDRLEAGFLAALRATREHALLDRLVRTEPETLVPLLVADGGPVIAMVRPVVETVVASGQPHLDAVRLRRLADVITRLLVSYAVSAPDDPPEVVAEFVATALTHGAASTLTHGAASTSAHGAPAALTPAGD
jgi:AcrR family transcriptional regulator